jgi:hypothetical protein
MPNNMSLGPPPAPPQLGILVLRDWFLESWMREDRARVDRYRELLGYLTQRFPGAHCYEFLPIVGIEASAAEFEELAALPGVRFVIRPRFALDYYSAVLKALNALRSQTGHQMFSFYAHLGNGGRLPDEGWEGGLWPARPGYPALRAGARRMVEVDDSITARVSPAIMPVINMSFGPKADLEYLAAGDPVVLAQAAVHETHLLVVAVGNSGAAPGSPWARGDNLLAVGATEDVAGNTLAAYSSTGSESEAGSGPDVVAFGGSPMSEGSPGTSFAAPRVASIAIVCQAAIAQAQRVWAMVNGAADAGVPLVGMGVIDLDRRGFRPRADLPGLPFAGVNEDALRDAFSLLVGIGVQIRFAINPAALRQAIVDSARPMHGYAREEVGAGFVSLENLVAWLSGLTAAELVERWSSTQIPPAAKTALEKVRPFEADGLKALARITLMTRPTWVHELDRGRFSVDPAVPLERYDEFLGVARSSLDSGYGHADAVLWTDP